MSSEPRPGVQRGADEPHPLFPDIPNRCPVCDTNWVVPTEEVWEYECLECGDGPRSVYPGEHTGVAFGSGGVR